MKNSFKTISNVLRMLPEDEPVSYSRLATIFEELAGLEVKNDITQADDVKFVCPACNCITGTTCSHSWHYDNKGN